MEAAAGGGTGGIIAALYQKFMTDKRLDKQDNDLDDVRALVNLEAQNTIQRTAVLETQMKSVLESLSRLESLMLRSRLTDNTKEI